MNEQAVLALKALLTTQGQTLLAQPGRLKSLLQDECPEAKREISALLLALEERIPQDLLVVHSGEPIGNLLARLAKRLSEQRALAGAAALWAVRAWAGALGLEEMAAASVAAPSADEFDFDGEVRNSQDAHESAMRGRRSVLQAMSQPVPRHAPLRWGRILVGLIAVLAAGAWFALPYVWPPLKITGVTMPSGFLGDGQPHEVFVKFQTREATVARIRSRFVEGDGQWNPQPSFADVVIEDSRGGRASGGTLGMRSTKPARVTFEYVLIDTQGRESKPHQRTFKIVPLPASLPRITAIETPGRILAGREFNLDIAYKDAEFGVAKVERRVIESSVKWAQETAVFDFEGGARQQSGSFPFKFSGENQPSTNTLEFVLIDTLGNRSAPKRVAYTVLAANGASPSAKRDWESYSTAPRSPVSRSERTSREPPSLDEDREQPAPRSGQSCRNCGVIASINKQLGEGSYGGGRSRPIAGRGFDGILEGMAERAAEVAAEKAEEYARGGSAWEVTVRFDSGRQQVFTQNAQPQWNVGDRVQVDNGVIRPL